MLALISAARNTIHSQLVITVSYHISSIFCSSTLNSAVIQYQFVTSLLYVFIRLVDVVTTSS